MKIFQKLNKQSAIRAFSKRYEEEVYKVVEKDPDVDSLTQKIRNGETLTREQEILLDTAVNRALYQAKQDFYSDLNQNERSGAKPGGKNQEKEQKVRKHPVTGQIIPPEYEIVKD